MVYQETYVCWCRSNANWLGNSLFFLVVSSPNSSSAGSVKHQLSAEERYCLYMYGDDYRKYMKRTPRWIGIPKL